MKKKLFIMALPTVTCMLAGCYLTAGSPKIRGGSYASASLMTNFQGPGDLGQHGSFREGNGQVYTCRAGHIDLAHLRKSADYTRYFAKKIFTYLMEGKSNFTLRMRAPSLYLIQLDYPEKWENLSQQQKQQIAWNASIGLGAYISYTGMTWHEILTWFGFRSTLIAPETASTFTWEDNFSNLLGAHIAGKALNNIAEHSFNKSLFNKSMTSALKEELSQLGIQPAGIAKRTSERMNGTWYSTAGIYVTMKKMNLDIGFDDGYVTPWIVPDVAECNGAKPKPYPIPTTDFLRQYGFSIELQIEPRIRGGEKILWMVGKTKTVEPQVDFPIIVKRIRAQAAKKYNNSGVDYPF